MHQGVLNQCTSVAHNSSFSDESQSAESFLFTFQYLHIWGIISLPILMHMGYSYHPIYFSNICCLIRGIYHPIYFQWGICPSHCWLHLLHIKSPIPMGHKILHRAPFQPILSWGTLPSHLIIFFFLTHGAPVLPIVICSSNIPLFGTHGQLDFCLTAHN